MSEIIKLADSLTARIGASSCLGRYEAKIMENGRYRGTLYANTLTRLNRKCEQYAERERKSIAYVAGLNKEDS